jgi:hypothetical protein
MEVAITFLSITGALIFSGVLALALNNFFLSVLFRALPAGKKERAVISSVARLTARPRLQLVVVPRGGK